MPQAPLLHRAKQGDAAAIATLINRHATSLGVVAHVNLKQHCLHIILEGQEPPPRLFWSHYLQRSLNRLGATSITQLQLYGRAHGSKHSAWSTTVDLPIAAPSDVPPPPFQGVNTAAAHTTCLPDSVPHTERYRSRARVQARATHDVKRRSSHRKASPQPSPPAALFWAFLPRDWSRVNITLAVQWFLSTVLMGFGTVALYHWGRSTAPLTDVINQLPQVELILACVGILGWILGWIQGSVLKGWVVSSEQWIPTTVVGMIAALLCVTLSPHGLYLALPLVAVVQWLTLKRWVNRAHTWIIAHTATALAALVAIPMMAAIVTTFEWGRDLAFDLNLDYESAVAVGLLWLIYSTSSAIAMGKLFQRP